MSVIIHQMESAVYGAIDRGWIPDCVLRVLIRLVCFQRSSDLQTGNLEHRHNRKFQFIDGLKSLPVALYQKKANQQHYEVPTELMKSTMGYYMKYSCCYFPKMNESLDRGEVFMLEDYCRKARLEDGQEILDLGCGWGSLSLFLAETYPKSRITALSNSRTQKLHIDEIAAQRGLKNVTVYTNDIMVFEFESNTKFDRIMSIEMLEHMKNYEYLFEKISNWLKPDGLFFAHVFCHHFQPYHFEEKDGWMAQNFFTGGTMPSLDLFSYFQTNLNLEKSWFLSGLHYSRTAELWLQNLDLNRQIWLSNSQIVDLINNKNLTYNQARSQVYVDFFRFRTFFLAVAEFFRYNKGETWGIGHYLFSKKNFLRTD